MKTYLKRLVIINLLILLNLFFSKSAYAYLDPGTGSYFFQLLIGFLLGGLFAVKLFWNQIKLFLVKSFSKSKKK